VGQIMAGTVGPAAGWRLPFVLASAPAILLAFILYMTAGISDNTRLVIIHVSNPHVLNLMFSLMCIQ